MKLMITLLTILALSGCTSMNNNFDCPLQGGVSCKPLSEIDNMVTRGEIGTGHQTKMATTVSQTPSQRSIMTFPETKLLSRDEPIRLRELVTRVWFAPFEDTDGNYHAENYLYAVVKPGLWSGSPVKIPTFD